MGRLLQSTSDLHLRYSQLIFEQVIPEPRCLDNIKEGVEKDRYKDVSDVYNDLALVFWNALYYNEEGSQISNDAMTLKVRCNSNVLLTSISQGVQTLLEGEWSKRPILGAPRKDPPASSPQRVYNLVEEEKKVAEPAKPVPPVAKGTPTPAPVTSTSNLQVSVARASSPDVDVDGFSPDSDGQAMDDGPAMERDNLSEEVVKQLERGLPRWQGFGDKGWMEYATVDRMHDLLHAIKSHKDVVCVNHFEVLPLLTLV